MSGQNVATIPAQIRIKGFIPLSMLDWPGKICSVIFLAGCNFRCPACHNHRLVIRPETIPDCSHEKIMAYLQTRKGWIDGVTVTGGEPTVDPGLEDLLRVISQSGFSAKLDTNGSNPLAISKLIALGLIDAVSMDIKAPLDSTCYSRVTGRPTDVRNIKRSIEIIRTSGIEFFFRTTVIPGLVAERELAEIKEAIGQDSPYIVQAFRNTDTLDPDYSKVPEYGLERIEKMKARFEARVLH